MKPRKLTFDSLGIRKARDNFCTRSTTCGLLGTDASWSQMFLLEISWHIKRDQRLWSHRQSRTFCFSTLTRKILKLLLSELSSFHRAARLKLSSGKSNPKFAETSLIDRTEDACQRALVCSRPSDKDVRARSYQTQTQDTLESRDLQTTTSVNSALNEFLKRSVKMSSLLTFP